MKSKKARRVMVIIATFFLVTGIGLLLFPPVSNTYGKYVARNISDDLQRICSFKNWRKDSTF